MFDPKSLTTIDRDYRRGDKGGKVKLIQEWLSLHGLGLVLDGDFGPATESAVKDFQTRNLLPADGVVTAATFALLAKPMTEAMKPVSMPGSTLGALVAAYARQHLAQHPREIGGQNMGPWVRLYMKGEEGKEQLWCAGFACFILEQACRTQDTAAPIQPSFRCSELATRAREKQIMVSGGSQGDKVRVGPGSFFLVIGGPTGHKHVGVVDRIDGDVFRTIEGNSNVEGSSNGYEVCRNTRTFDRYDFIAI